MTFKETTPKVLVFSAGLIPSVVIGILKPLVELEKLGEITLRIRTSSIQIYSFTDIQWCDVAVFCRNSELTDLHCLYQLKRLGKRIIYEIDDNFEEIPLNSLESFHHRTAHRLHVLRRFYLLADMTRIYSPIIEHSVKKHGGTACLVHSYFDYQLIQGQAKSYHSNVIKIAYPTSRIDPPELKAFICEVFRQILMKYGNNIEIHLWYSAIPEQLIDFKQVFIHPKVPKYEKFVRLFYGKGFDIGVAPLLDEPFYHSKTNNKYRELGGCGVAGVYSDMPPYCNCVLQNKTGMLAKHTIESWVNKISELINNPSLRQTIINGARKDIVNNYNFSTAIESYRSCIHAVMQEKAKLCHWLYDNNLCFSAAGIIPPTSTVLPHVAGVMHLLRGTLSLFQTIQHLMVEPLIKQFNFVFILIKKIDELSNFDKAIQFFNSIILDLSEFQDEPNKFIARYKQFNVNKPITLIFNENQIEMQAMANALGHSFATVKSDATLIDNDFSLHGYPATYLDVFERHIIYGIKLKKTPTDENWFMASFSAIKNRLGYRNIKQQLKKYTILLMIKCNIDRIKHMLTFLYWRFLRSKIL